MHAVVCGCWEQLLIIEVREGAGASEAVIGCEKQRTRTKTQGQGNKQTSEAFDYHTPSQCLAFGFHTIFHLSCLF